MKPKTESSPRSRAVNANSFARTNRCLWPIPRGKDSKPATTLAQSPLPLLLDSTRRIGQISRDGLRPAVRSRSLAIRRGRIQMNEQLGLPDICRTVKFGTYAQVWGSILLVTHVQTSLSDVWTGSAITDIPSELAIQAVRPRRYSARTRKGSQGYAKKKRTCTARVWHGPVDRLSREIWNTATVKMALSEELCERGNI
jgi:hypothetical protein